MVGCRPDGRQIRQAAPSTEKFKTYSKEFFRKHTKYFLPMLACLPKHLLDPSPLPGPHDELQLIYANISNTNSNIDLVSSAVLASRKNPINQPSKTTTVTTAKRPTNREIVKANERYIVSLYDCWNSVRILRKHSKASHRPNRTTHPH